MIFSLDLINKLDKLKIKYELSRHEALYTVKDSGEKRILQNGAHTKNLFLKNKKIKFIRLCMQYSP